MSIQSRSAAANTSARPNPGTPTLHGYRAAQQRSESRRRQGSSWAGWRDQRVAPHHDQLTATELDEFVGERAEVDETLVLDASSVAASAASEPWL
jgi:hypothetical protein